MNVSSAGLGTSFGSRVRELRLGLSLTQQQLAEATELSVEWLRRIESGQASPSFDTIAALANALSVEPEALFSQVQSSPASQLEVISRDLTSDQIAWLIQGVRLLRRGSEQGVGERPSAAAGAPSVAAPTHDGQNHALPFEERVWRIVRAFEERPPTETERRIVQVLLDHPNSTSTELSGALGWAGQVWHAHFGKMVSSRREHLWPGEWVPSREAEFYSGVLAELSEPDHRFVMRPEAFAGFAILGIVGGRFRKA